MKTYHKSKFSTLIFMFLLMEAQTVVSLGCRLPSAETEVKATLEKVSHWQIRHFSYSTGKNLHDDGIDAWTNSTLYIGMSQWSKIHNDSICHKWLQEIGNTTDWKMPANFTNYPQYGLFHADELCIGQFYLDMFEFYGRPQMFHSIKERADYIMKHPKNPSMQISNKQLWTWCDALFMAAPVYAHLARIEKNDAYLRYMDEEFKKTYSFLYDKKEKLFFRDSSYFNKREANGKKVFWGRGNGWVAAALVNILKQLPEDSIYRPFYEKLFREFIPRLAELQSPHGFWHASLLDPRSYPSPETSASALITYALSYGINEELLSEEKYLPTVQKAWKSLLSAVNEDGKLGWVQPVGADPKKVTAGMTAHYGVGAFLLAGCEIYRFYISKRK